MPFQLKIYHKTQSAKFSGFREFKKRQFQLLARPWGPNSIGFSKCLNTFTMENIRVFAPQKWFLGKISLFRY